MTIKVKNPNSRVIEECAEQMRDALDTDIRKTFAKAMAFLQSDKVGKLTFRTKPIIITVEKTKG